MKRTAQERADQRAINYKNLITEVFKFCGVSSDLFHASSTTEEVFVDKAKISFAMMDHVERTLKFQFLAPKIQPWATLAC